MLSYFCPPNRWQATTRPFPASTNGGSFVRQMSPIMFGQRVWNLQPDGGLTGLGISPLITTSARADVGSGTGTAAIRDFV